MTPPTQLKRFLNAWELNFQIALLEMKSGKKQSHWMWYIFPQIHGLGFSDISKFYAIKNIKEAEEFLQHPVLGSRLILICNELLKLEGNNAREIFGTPDDLKLRSSMTLFSTLRNTSPVFQLVLKKFFMGKKDQKTLQIISSANDS